MRFLFSLPNLMAVENNFISAATQSEFFYLYKFRAKAVRRDVKQEVQRERRETNVL